MSKLVRQPKRFSKNLSGSFETNNNFEHDCNSSLRARCLIAVSPRQASSKLTNLFAGAPVFGSSLVPWVSRKRTHDFRILSCNPVSHIY